MGDTVQVGNFQGRVRRIGIRASISTAQGGNHRTQRSAHYSRCNQLDAQRPPAAHRPAGGSYRRGRAKKVIELIEAVARAHPQVLHDPAPRCLFMNYADNAINFELRAWTDFANSGQVHSDLTVAIYEAVNAAG